MLLSVPLYTSALTIKLCGGNENGVIYRSERLLLKNLQFIIVMENLEFAISKKNTLEQIRYQ